VHYRTADVIPLRERTAHVIVSLADRGLVYLCGNSGAPYAILVYVLAIISLGWCPWNYLLLGALLLRRHADENLRGKS
jgi:hypothetical protein